MNSIPLLGTHKKTKMNRLEYIWFSCILQGFHNCHYSFLNWRDLIGGNHSGYGILPEDDDLEYCISYFWESLQPEIYSKEFLDYLMQISNDVKEGRVETVEWTEEMMNEDFGLIDD
jgi:hypothetical protein